MDPFATKLAEGFASRLILPFFEAAVTDKITNKDYEGEIRNTKSKVNIMTFGSIPLRDFNGSDMSSPDDPMESVGELVTDQKKSYYFKIPSLEVFESWIKNPEGTLIDTLSSRLKEVVDRYILGFYTDVAAGNRVGTDYVTGTVAVAATSGVVTGSGTTFTAAMVGRGFTCDGLVDADGNAKWYRVKARNSNTEIVIENDEDDSASHYDGGAISAGAGYKIEAVTAVQMTKDLAYGQILELATKLDMRKVPKTDRWLVMPSALTSLLKQNSLISPAISEAYNEVVKRNYLGTIAGFDLYESEQVNGDGTNGYRVMAGHKSAITYALGFTETGIEDLKGNFGKAYKGLTVYGAKVVDERRKALTEGFFKL